MTKSEQEQVDAIVEQVTAAFRADLERIMKQVTKRDDLTIEQQCQLVAEASGWQRRAETEYERGLEDAARMVREYGARPSGDLRDLEIAIINLRQPPCAGLKHWPECK